MLEEKTHNIHNRLAMFKEVYKYICRDCLQNNISKLLLRLLCTRLGMSGKFILSCKELITLFTSISYNIFQLVVLIQVLVERCQLFILFSTIVTSIRPILMLPVGQGGF